MTFSTITFIRELFVRMTLIRMTFSTITFIRMTISTITFNQNDIPQNETRYASIPFVTIHLIVVLPNVFEPAVIVKNLFYFVLKDERNIFFHFLILKARFMLN